jgi:hypothetical protein
MEENKLEEKINKCNNVVEKIHNMLVDEHMSFDEIFSVLVRTCAIELTLFESNFNDPPEEQQKFIDQFCDGIKKEAEFFIVNMRNQAANTTSN